MDNNPLRQYFRRPAVYMRLPSGGEGYEPGTLEMPESGEIPVYPMTAIDEITSRTPDALFNGTALAELIKSCIPAIKDPWAVSSSDMDAVLISIKIASGSDVMEIIADCPECKETSTYGLNLSGVLSTIKAGDYSSLLNLGDLTIKFKPVTYRIMNEASLGQFELQRAFMRVENVEDEDEKNRITKEALENLTLLTMKNLNQAWHQS